MVERGKIAAIYPEARYSLCGTKATLPVSLGKLVKRLNVPVVVLITYGHHVNSPFWNTKSRGVKTRARMEQIVTQEQVENLKWEEIFNIIDQSFEYDDFKWQRINQIPVTFKNRAKGLHKVLYHCPHCKTEYRMNSDRDELWCEHCGKRWTMSVYGELNAAEGESYFTHIPDWYEWEREQVRQEVEKGTYYLECEAKVRSLPNSKGYLNIGDATIVHSMSGFELKGEFGGAGYSFTLPSQSVYACHIEYDYLHFKRDAVELNTLTDSVWIFPKGNDFSVTKISLATEEIFNYLNQKNLSL